MISASKSSWQSGARSSGHPPFWRSLVVLLTAWALGGILSAADAAIFWQHPDPIQVRENSVEIFQGALAPRDDSSGGTLYFKLRVNPQSDIVTDIETRQPYLAGLVFCRGDTEMLGIGNAWNAWGYGAFCKTFSVKGNEPGEFSFKTDNPDIGANSQYLAPRRGVANTLVVKVEFLPGSEDWVTVWLDPDLSPGATESGQPEECVTRFKADASFDRILLTHRGEGPGWIFDDLAAATTFGDFVPEPFWRRNWFHLMVGATIAALTIGCVIVTERRRGRKKMQLVEREQAVTAERIRIAQDLHDDLGARLTEIVLLGEVASKPDTATDPDSLREMIDGLRQLHACLDEVVWSINPRNDSLVHLVEFVSESAQRFLRHAPVEFHFEVAGELPSSSLTAGQRHNLALAVKEALNNAVRHAGATEIRLRVERTDTGVRLSVADDGRGMDESRRQTGDGLRNMCTRLNTIGGSAAIHSQPGAGTEVVFDFPL